MDRLIGAYRADGRRVEVVAIDPSSAFSGGAILGDRVRMQEHATDPCVFIRSMASRGHLGGLSRAANDAVDLLDAAGFDPVTGKLFPAVRGALAAWISPDGERVLVAREAPLEGGRAFRLELWPFSEGTGSPFGTTRKGRGISSWSQDDRIIYQLVQTGTSGTLEHLATEVASGQVLWRRPVPDTLRGLRMTASLLLYTAKAPSQGGTPLEWRSYPLAGQSPLVFSFPDSSARVFANILSADGRGSWVAALITATSAIHVLDGHVARGLRLRRSGRECCGP